MRLRVLLSEGSSTSAREAVTVLGLAGHHVEICDPSPWCLARFSSFVRKFHHCPGLRDDPAGYLGFILKLLASGRFDVLLPTHEQGFLFARVRDRIPADVHVALPDFASYRTALSKAGFCRLLDELALPQPQTSIVASEAALRAAARLPCVLKTAIGTASRGIWFVQDQSELDRAVRELNASGSLADGVLVQDFIAGTTEKAQGVFCRGRLVGFHAFRRLAPGAGGGEAIKESVARPHARAMLARIGAHLAWHGGLSVDYLMPEAGARPLLIDCNPRVVEPMSAYLAGTDLITPLLGISLGETPDALPESRAGVKTRLAMQALLGCAAHGGSRRELLRACGRLMAESGPYENTFEELTPVRLDWLGAVPLSATALLLLASPSAAQRLARSGFGAHLLDRESIARIERDDFAAAL
ncbi:hypothetical protein [Bradyrhizobium sp. NP1]|uniref:hypothetical protein n=1 Tax=Bradyrhizobium sp. NP1 TaxID=3049772 RepID=UPI0025A4E42E|nr:hypothetical protein [Bradyrhizobium sp. NP1]WJR78876.1 hypothetical protein QOU61_03455 [Bradyrhizobium sp. NP1]